MKEIVKGITFVSLKGYAAVPNYTVLCIRDESCFSIHPVVKRK